VWVEEMLNAGDNWLGVYHMFLVAADGALLKVGNLRPENLATEFEFVNGIGIAAGSFAEVVRDVRPRGYYVNAFELRGGLACRIYIARPPFAGEAVECLSNERRLSWQGPEGVDLAEFNYRACMKLAEADSSVKCAKRRPQLR
jgi:hypothetical protein